MKMLTVVAALGLALSAGPVLAQQKPPARKPAPSPRKPAATAPGDQAPRPFPAGSKIAYCSLDRVAALSKEGQASFLKVKALSDQKTKAIQDKTKAMEATQAQLNSPSLDDEKRAALQKELSRQEVDIQRMQQDSSAEVTELQNEERDAFVLKVMPLVQQIALERGIHMVFNYQDGLVLWVDSGLDLSAEVAKRLDARAAAPQKMP